MRTRFMTTLILVASLLISGQALAQPQLPTFQSGDVLRADDLNRIVDQVRSNMTASGGSGGGTTHTAACPSGSIANAMAQAQPGDTIRISGTCRETVVVDKDGITLDGGGSAVIDGGGADASVIAVLGHQNVILKGLTVQNGLIGVHVGRGAAAWLENVTARNSRSKAGHTSGVGIIVANSSDAVLAGRIAATGNAAQGMLVWQGGRASVVGNAGVEGARIPQASLQASSNGWNGIEVGVGSSFQVLSNDGAYSTVQANNNGGTGIWVDTGSSAQFGGGASIEATGNGEGGLGVGGGSSTRFAVWPSRGVEATFNNNKHGIGVGSGSALVLFYEHDSGASITATNNTGFGLAVSQGSSVQFETPLSQVTSARLNFSDNGSPFGGVGIFQNSAFVCRLPAVIERNAYDGLQVWGNSFAEFAESVIADNGRNGALVSLGSSLFLWGTTVRNNNNAGIAVFDGSRLSALDAEITGNGGEGVNAGTAGASLGRTTVTGNGGNGVHVWDGSVQLHTNTTVTGNAGTDVWAGGGSRLHGYGGNVQIGTVGCDGSVESFNPVSCP